MIRVRWFAESHFAIIVAVIGMGSMVDKLTILPGGGNPDEIKGLLKEFKAAMPSLIEYHKFAAKLHWEKFNALKKEGFTDEQALELCKILVERK